MDAVQSLYRKYAIVPNEGPNEHRLLKILFKRLGIICNKCVFSIYIINGQRLNFNLVFQLHKNCDKCLLRIVDFCTENNEYEYEIRIEMSSQYVASHITNYISLDLLRQIIHQTLPYVSMYSICTLIYPYFMSETLNIRIDNLIAPNTNGVYRNSYDLNNIIRRTGREYLFELQESAIRIDGFYVADWYGPYYNKDIEDIKRSTNVYRTSYIRIICLMLGVVRRLRHPDLATPLIDYIASYVIGLY